MPFESTLPDRTTADTDAQLHINDHMTMHGMLKDKPWYNVMDYGSSNNAARVQAAIDACATAGGGVVYMPANITFAFGASTVTMDHADNASMDNVTLRGDGAKVSKITYTGAGPAIFWGTTETGLSNPRGMGELRGFGIYGPGKTSPAGGKAITISQARYFTMYDIYVEKAETGFNFDCAGGVFGTGGECHQLRADDVRKGYFIGDSDAAPNAEWTDMKFHNCYANSGYTSGNWNSGLAVGSVGFHVSRGNTNQFYGCSQEAFEVGLRLGDLLVMTDSGGAMTNGSPVLNTTKGIFKSSDVGRSLSVAGALVGPNTLTTTIASFTSAYQVTLAANATLTVSNKVVTLFGVGQSLRNAFYYFRDEISGQINPEWFHDTAQIIDGDDNAFLGSKGTIRDYTGNQCNVIISKRGVSRTGGDTHHRLIRVLDRSWSSTGAMTSGNPTLTSTSGVFCREEVGRTVNVVGAGGGGTTLSTTALECISPTQMKLAANAGATVGPTAQFLIQAGLPAPDAAQEGNMLFQERKGSADRLIFYYTNASDTPTRRDLIAGADF